MRLWTKFDVAEGKELASMNYYNKNILFLSWKFYEYPEKIKEKLEEKGAKVTYYNAVPTESHLKMKLMTKLNFLRTKYEDKIIEEEKGKRYDYILVINPALFELSFLEKIISVTECEHKIAYLWDSISTFPEVKSTFKLFDRIYSFDKQDCNENKKLSFLPLFYIEENNKERLQPNYTFCFVGFAHTQRYQFIKKIQKYAEENGYTYCFKLYLPSKLHYLYGKYVKKYYPEGKLDDFIFKSLKQSEIHTIMENSKIVIDMELKNQNGLTMRTIESLGMRRKLITTNPHVQEYDFYNSGNILVVDRDRPELNTRFICSEYQKFDDDVYARYSLTKWIEFLLGD